MAATTKTHDILIKTDGKSTFLAIHCRAPPGGDSGVKMGSFQAPVLTLPILRPDSFARFSPDFRTTFA